MSTDEFPMPYSVIFSTVPGHGNLMDNYHQVGPGVWSIQITWQHPTKKLQVTHSTERSASTRTIITDMPAGPVSTYVISGFGVKPGEVRYISCQVLGGTTEDDLAKGIRATAVFIPIPFKSGAGGG